MNHVNQIYQKNGLNDIFIKYSENAGDDMESRRKAKENIQLVKKNATIFVIGGAGYGFLETAFRGFTHWTMLVTGGFVFLILYYINSRNENAPLWKKCIVGAVIITSVEFAVGCVVNLWLGWSVWDYSSYSYNVLGQVCLTFTVLWFFLCIPLSYLTRYLHIRRFRTHHNRI